MASKSPLIVRTPYVSRQNEPFRPLRNDADAYESIGQRDDRELETRIRSIGSQCSSFGQTSERQRGIVVAIGRHITIFDNGEMQMTIERFLHRLNIFQLNEGT